MMKARPLFIALLAASAQLVAAQSTFFLVRHAEKAEAASGSQDAKDPALSEAGRARAESLATLLKDAGISAIFATEFKRTQQTAEPLAHAGSLAVEVIPAKETAGLVSKLKETQGNALVVGHSNTIPDILKALGATVVYSIDEGDYDDLFVFVPGATPQLIRLHVPAPANLQKAGLAAPHD
ncbi:MAG: histidine phosphatase family protein [Chthoniobacterales bacterium]|nr:histidine phosphatase family protein [Chthoniobacterales bacterium]MBA3762244.1 histidine phosphatase family protein [Chthoniobacterales bacterium]